MIYDLHGGGVEKALTTMLNEMDYDRYSITLLLLKKEGVHLENIPNSVEIKIVDIQSELRDEIMLSSKEIVAKHIMNREYVLSIKKLIGIILNKIIGKREVYQELFDRCDKELYPLNEIYDLAIDYQGLGSGVFCTYYVAEKINSKKKATWIHQDLRVIKNDVSWMGKYYNKFDKVYAVSLYSKREFVNLFPDYKDKADVFYNILPVDSILDKGNELIPFNKKSSEIIILSVGRLSYQKGYDVAIKAIKNLVQEDYNVRYYIVGEGEQKNNLAKLISSLGLIDYVKLIGYAKNPYPYMKHCDVYLQPSRFEGFCLTLGEAKVFNKPIITTDFIGANEQLSNEETGLIIKCDEFEITKSIKQIIDDVNLKNYLVKNLESSRKGTPKDIFKIEELLL